MIYPKPRLAVTTGDCAGIGPELVLRALNSKQVAERASLTIHGNLNILKRVSRQSGISFDPKIQIINTLDDPRVDTQKNVIINTESAELEKIRPSRSQKICGTMAARWIEMAVADTLADRSDAVVTAPINKNSFSMAGVKFPGHTEMLASLCDSTTPCMAFYTPGFIVSLVTIHTAISNVPAMLKIDHLLNICRLTHQLCLRQGVEKPNIGMLALNPHAGENGLFGTEEKNILTPAIAAARDQGLNIEGPLVPDTAFTWLYPPRQPAPFDAYVAMYHDQALIPFKMAAFDTGVNITLGLPIIRTSPDHGTAFDLAWRGKASPNSFFAAIRLAAKMAAGAKSARAR